MGADSFNEFSAIRESRAASAAVPFWQGAALSRKAVKAPRREIITFALDLTRLHSASDAPRTNAFMNRSPQPSHCGYSCRLVLAFLVLLSCMRVTAQIPWAWSNSLPQGNSLNSVAYGNGLYVAVGESGTTMVSADGAQWTVNPSLGPYTLNAVTYANGAFLAVGFNSGSASIVGSSVDGVHWTVNTSGFQSVSLPNALAYGMGVYVSAGGGGSIQYSVNGSIWNFASGGSSSLNAIAVGGGKFVAVGVNGYVAISSDGSTWTSQTVGNQTFDSIAYGNGQFVAVTNTGKIYVSADGVNWTLNTANIVSDYSIVFTSPLQTFGRVAFVNGQFMLPAGNAAVFTSSNGVQWTSHLLRTSSYLRATAYGVAGYVAVGTGGAIFTSTDGGNWTEQSASLVGQTIYAGAAGGGIYVMAGESGKISSSTDATNWAIRSSGTTKTLYGSAYGGSRFVVVGDAGVVRWSSNGTTWNAGASNTNLLLDAVTYGNGNFVAVGAAGVVLKSSDGAAWSVNSAGTTEALTGVTYGNGLFAAVSARGDVYTSPDAVTWTARNSGFASFLASITFAQSRFVAAGWGGTILTSTDGISWTMPTPATTQCLNSVIYNSSNAHFIASGSLAGFVSSTDGLTWTASSSYGGPVLALVAEPSGPTIRARPDGTTITVGSILAGESASSRTLTGTNLRGVTYGNSRFVTVGDWGAIFASSNGISWQNQASTPAFSGSSPSLASVAYAGGRFVAVGGSSSRDAILTSTDGLTWADHSKGTGNALLGVSYGNSRYVAVGNNGKILYSADSNTWTAATSGTTDNLLAVAYGNGVYVAVSSSSVLRSSDGIAWQNASFFAGKNVRFDQGVFIAINGLGIVTSSDGITWVTRASPSNFVNVTGYGSGLYLTLAAPADGVLTFLSRDTSTWYPSASSSPVSKAGLRSTAFDGNAFVAVGDNGSILRSAVTWPSLAQWRTIYYDTASNTGIAADAAMPLNDGVSNLMKYALGVDPRRNGIPSLPLGQILFDATAGSNYLTMTISRKAIAPGVTYVVEVSGDLATWRSVAGTDIAVLANTALLLKVRDNLPAGGSAPLSRFIRLRITNP